MFSIFIGNFWKYRDKRKQIYTNVQTSKISCQHQLPKNILLAKHQLLKSESNRIISQIKTHERSEFSPEESIQISNSLFYAAQSATQGGAILSLGNISVTDCKFILCYSAHSAGVLFSTGQVNSTRNSIITAKSEITSSIRIISSHPMPLNISMTTHLECNTDHDGTIFYFSPSNATFTNNNFTLSSCNGAHCGVLIEDSTADIKYDIMSKNGWSHINSAFVLKNPPRFIIDRCLFDRIWRYSGVEFGGVAIYVEHNPVDSFVCESIFYQVETTLWPHIWTTDGSVIQVTSCCFSGLKAIEWRGMGGHQQINGCYFNASCVFFTNLTQHPYLQSAESEKQISRHFGVIVAVLAVICLVINSNWAFKLCPYHVF